MPNNRFKLARSRVAPKRAPYPKLRFLRKESKMTNIVIMLILLTGPYLLVRSISAVSGRELDATSCRCVGTWESCSYLLAWATSSRPNN